MFPRQPLEAVWAVLLHPVKRAFYQICHCTKEGCLLQDAGLLALVAAANVEPVPTALPVDSGRLPGAANITTHVLPVDSSLLACHQPASVQQGTAVQAKRADADESGAQEPAGPLPCKGNAVDQDGVAAASAAVLAAADPLPGRYKQPQPARRRKQKRRDPSAGVTPEHMLYWVSQADVAAQLRCTDTVCSAAAVLLPEAGGAIQDACTSLLPCPLLPAEQQCTATRCQQQTSRIAGNSSAASTLHCAIEPVILHKSSKRRQGS